jgi:hypothetical protein
MGWMAPRKLKPLPPDLVRHQHSAIALRSLLKSYQKYYNEARTHLSLQKDAPIPRPVQTVGQTLAVPILGGLHHQYTGNRDYSRLCGVARIGAGRCSNYGRRS